MSGILGGIVGTFSQTNLKNITVLEVSKTTSTISTSTIQSSAISMSSGKVYIAMLAWEPTGNQTPTVSLSDGLNTYSSLSGLYSAPATTAAGVGVLIQSFIMSASNTSSRTITATFGATVSPKVMTVIEVDGITTTQRNAATVSRGTTTAPNYNSPAGLTYDFILTTFGQETNIAGQPTSGSTSTVGGTWSAISNNFTTGGSAATNVGISYQWKMLLADSTQSNAWTMGSTNNWGSQSFAIQATPVP